MKNFLQILSILLCTFVVAACGGSSNALPKNDIGRSLEDLAPYDSHFVFTYGTNDQSQRDNFSNLIKKLGLEQLKSEYMVSVNELLAASNLTFEDDLKPMLGEDYRTLVAFMGGGEERSDEADATIELYDYNYEGELIIAFSVADVTKAEEFLNIVSKQENMILGDKEGHLTLTDTVEGIHIMLLDNFIVMTANDEYLTSVLARYNDLENSLADNEMYLKAFGSFEEPQFAYIYMAFEPTMIDSSSVTEFRTNPFQILDYQIYGIGVRDDGFSFDGFAQLDKKEMKKMKTNLTAFSGPGAYLIDYLSADNLIGYGESYNLADSIRNNAAFTEQSLNDGFRAFFGTDIEDGLFSWMDRGVAIMFQKTDWILPGITIAFDASSNVEAARDFYLKVDGQLSGYIALAGEELGDAVRKETFENLATISVDTAPFDDGSLAAIFPEKPLPTIELTYGLTTDDLFVISIQNNFYTNYGKNSVADSEKYKKALGVIDNIEGGLLYLDFDLLDEYVSDLAQLILQQMLMENASAPAEQLSAMEASETEFRNILNQVLDVLQKIDFVIVGSEAASDDLMKTAGYLKLK